MKKFFKGFLDVILHLVIAAAIVFLGYYVGEICDDIVTSWSTDGYWMGISAGVLVLIYWLKKATKRLEA